MAGCWVSVTVPSHVARHPLAWDSNLCPQARPAYLREGTRGFGVVSFPPWHPPDPHPGALGGPGHSVGGGYGPASIPEPEAPLPLPPRGCQRLCGRPVGGQPPPPQRAGQQPSRFHQLIIFTNLQACKKAHSGLNTLGQEPCGKAEGTEAGYRRPRPGATSCLRSASFLQSQTRPRPLQPPDKGCPAALTHRGPQPRPPAAQPSLSS